jgi:hypothetical protein
MDEAESIAEEENLAKNLSFIGETRSCLVSPDLRRSLRTARNWMLTLAVITSFWLGLAGVLSLIGIIATAGFGSSEMLKFVFTFSVLLVVLGIPLALMFQFASRTRRFVTSASLRDLVSALQAQRWMWTVLGIYGLIVIVFNIVTLTFPFLRIRL